MWLRRKVAKIHLSVWQFYLPQARQAVGYVEPWKDLDRVITNITTLLKCVLEIVPDTRQALLYPIYLKTMAVDAHGTQGLILHRHPLLNMNPEREREREREIKFISLFGDRGHRDPYSPYKPCNHNLYIGIIIFPHIDNPQSTGYN